jgi:hypothetical protein
MCCIGNAAWAAKEVNVAGKGMTGYAGDPIQITNWDSLQEEIQEAYGADVFVAKSQMDMEGFKDDETPKAYILLLGDFDIFSVINQPTPPKLAEKVLELFSDLKKSDFKAYDEGISIFAQDNKKGGHALFAILLKSREKSNIAPSVVDLISVKVNDNITLGFPSGSEIRSDRTTKGSGLTARSFTVETPLLSEDAATYITTQLSEKNVRFTENVSDGEAAISFQQDGMRATVIVAELNADEQTSMIQFVIYSTD